MCDEVERHIEDYDIENMLKGTERELKKGINKYKTLSTKEEKEEFISEFKAPIDDILLSIDDIIIYCGIITLTFNEVISIPDTIDRLKKFYIKLVLNEQKLLEHRIKRMQEVIDKLKEDKK